MDPKPCCEALTAECMSCSLGQTVEEYCQTITSPIEGCEDTPDCCTDKTVDCYAC